MLAGHIKRYTKLVAKLPFCGKMAVRQAAFSVYQADTLSSRWSKLIGLEAFLAFYVIVRGFQSWIAVVALRNLGAAPLAVKGILVLYAVANFLALSNQVILMARALIHCVKAPRPNKRTLKRHYISLSPAETAFAIVFTLVGQVVVGAIFVLV